MGGKERADYGWNGHTPDWKAEEYGVVAGDIGDRPFKRRFIATAALLLRLLHRLEIVFRVRLFRYDLEQVGSQRPADLTRDDTRVSAPRKIRNKYRSLYAGSRSRGNGRSSPCCER